MLFLCCFCSFTFKLSAGKEIKEVNTEAKVADKLSLYILFNVGKKLFI